MPKQKKTSILVVDEELEIRAFLNTFLKNKGFEVFTAASSAEAIMRLKKNQPDILILDALFSNQAALLNLKHTQDLPVIFISAIPLKTLLFRQKLHFSQKIISKCEPVPFLEKPLQEDELFSIIHSFINLIST